MTAERFRGVVSLILLLGVSLAAVLIAVGFVGAIAVGWSGSLAGVAGGTVAASTDFGSVAANLRALRPLGFAQLGLIVLILTPVARVAVSVAGFWLEGDRLYVVITAIVLGILLASLFLLH